MSRRQNPAIADDRAAAEADLVVHIAVKADLPGIFAVRRRMSADDHLGVRLAERLTVQAADQANKQQQARNKSIGSRHVMFSRTDFWVLWGWRRGGAGS